MVSNSNLFCSYHVILSLFKKFELIMEYGKMEIFHFSRLHEAFEPLPLDFMLLEGPILWLKNTWHYLRFIFNCKLTFQQHINFSSNIVISTIKCMKMLRDSLRGLIPNQKILLYRSCILPITLYGFQLWYYNKMLLSYSFKELRKI